MASPSKPAENAGSQTEEPPVVSGALSTPETPKVPMEEPVGKPSQWSVRRVLRWVRNAVGILLGGVAANGIWEFWGKPGVASAKGWAADTLANLSQSFSDSIYSTAAMDPLEHVAQEAHWRVSFLWTVALIWFCANTLGLTSPSSENRLIESLRTEVEEHPEERDEIRRRWIRKLLARATILVLFALVLGYDNIRTDLREGRAIDVARSFHANLTICAPYMAIHDRELLASRFAMMKTKADYDGIAGSLEQVAKQNGLTLHETH